MINLNLFWKIFCFKIMVFVISSCTIETLTDKTNNSPGNNFGEKVIVEQLESFQPVSSIFEQVRYLPLEKAGDAIVDGVSQILFLDGYIILCDQFISKEILIFNDKGEFVSRIDHFGDGRGNYMSINGVSIDAKNKQILVGDNTNQKMIRYNLDGTFSSESEVKFHFLNFKAFPEFDTYFFLIHQAIPWIDTDRAFNIAVTDGNFKVLSLQFPKNSIQQSYTFQENKSLISNTSGVYYSPKFSNKIYKMPYYGNPIELLEIKNKDEKAVNQQLIEMKDQFGEEELTPHHLARIIPIKQFELNGKYLHFQSLANGTFNNYYLDAVDNELFGISRQQALNNSNDRFDFVHLSPIGSIGNSFVTYVSARDYNMVLNNIQNKDRIKHLPEVDEFGNSVLVFFDLKGA